MSKKKSKKKIKYPPLPERVERYAKIKDKKHYEELQEMSYKWGEELERVAKLMVDDYKKNPPASGSENTVVQVHQDSPYISEKNYKSALKTLELVKLKKEQYKKLNKK